MALAFTTIPWRQRWKLVTNYNPSIFYFALYWLYVDFLDFTIHKNSLYPCSSLVIVVYKSTQNCPNIQNIIKIWVFSSYEETLGDFWEKWWQKDIKKNYTKSYESCTWEWCTNFAHDGLGLYHYTMMSAIETGNKLQYFGILFIAVL
jgi:hypothetical protein